MTRIVDLLEIIYINGSADVVYFSKDKIFDGDLLIAQSNAQELEEWYDVKTVLTLPYLKTGYTMYILTKHEK